jgi:hypothetical protein
MGEPSSISGHLEPYDSHIRETKYHILLTSKEKGDLIDKVNISECELIRFNLILSDAR